MPCKGIYVSAEFWPEFWGFLNRFSHKSLKTNKKKRIHFADELLTAKKVS